MRSTLIFAIAILCSFHAAAQEITDEQVLKAIKKAQTFLFNSQQGNHWELRKEAMNKEAKLGQYLGQTSIVSYSLLTSGIEQQASEQLQKAIEFLKAEETTGNYAVGLRSHVWAKLPPKFHEYHEADAEILVNALNEEGRVGYFVTPGEKWWDNSNIQYNMLDVWEAAKRGITFSGDYWQRIENHFLKEQQGDGGWGYNHKARPAPYGAMTAAALTCLFVTNDYLHAHEYKKPGAGKNIPTYQAIQKGLAWFDKDFNGKTQNNYKGFFMYYLVGVERIGVASGYKYFNNLDWYRVGAQTILKRQAQDGSVKASGHSSDTVVSTAFALVFLAAGRKPVFINKLKIDGYRWDNRPRDVNNVTHWVSDKVEKAMLWQVVDAKYPATDWLDAPVLYLASDQAFQPDAAIKAKIKKYIDTGGLFLTSADTGSTAFGSSIEMLAKELYPDFKWQKIPANDPIYNVVFNTDASKMPLYSLTNGIRHLIIHSDKDISWDLQTQNYGNKHTWETIANIYHYATEKGKIRPKLAQHFPKLKAGSSASNSATVIRVKHDGIWNPEPGAWSAANIYLKNAGKLSVSTEQVAIADLGASSNKFAHLTTSTKTEFSDEQAKELSTYVNNGGTVFLEAAGGKPEAAASLMQLIRKAFPGNMPRKLDVAHQVYTGEGINGFDCSRVTFRSYATLARRQVLRSGQLLGVEINGKVRVILSIEDFSNAMLQQPVWNVFGYSSDSACQLIGNMILYAKN